MPPYVTYALYMRTSYVRYLDVRAHDVVSPVAEVSRGSSFEGDIWKEDVGLRRRR